MHCFRPETHTDIAIRKYLRQCLWMALMLVLSLVGESAVLEETSNQSPENCENPEIKRIRLVSPAELATKTGVDGAEIWLSILGEVYDVSAGVNHYAPGSSYGAFAGRDASVPFVTGKFTAEEAAKSTAVLKTSELPGLAEWRDFYRTHPTYKFVGKLIDPRYYDENGEPTSDMMDLQRRIQEGRAEQAVKAKIRREERQKRLKEKAATTKTTTESK